jgi:hypothetical protein
MSENAVIQENLYVEPSGNPYDNADQSFREADESQSLEQAMDEKIEADGSESAEVEETLEANSEVEEKSDSKNDEFSAKFAALSRREKELRERESQIQEQYSSKLAELEAKIESLNAPKEEEVQKEPELPLEYRLKKDPLGTLAELGLSYDQLTNLALNDGKLTTEMQMQLMKEDLESKYNGKFESLQNELLERDKRQEEQKYEETVTNFKNELTDFVNNSDDKYELIQANDAVDVVYEVIEEHYKDTGRIMSKDEAADQVENYLEGEIEKLMKLSKLKNKFGLQEALKEQAKPAPVQASPTLSNAHSAAASKPSRPKTRDESLAYATSLLKWND